MNFKNLSRVSLLSLALTALLGGTVAASDETEVKIVTDGQAEVIVLRDLDQTLPVGETGEFTAESGKLVIVGRSEEGLLIDIDGEITDIKLPAAGMAADGNTQAVKVLVHGNQDGGEEIRVDSRVAIVHAGDGEVSTFGEEGKRVIMINSNAGHTIVDGDIESADGKRVVFIKSAGDESQIAEALALAGIDAEAQQRILVKINAEDGSGTGKQVIVTRRITQ